MTLNHRALRTFSLTLLLALIAATAQAQSIIGVLGIEREVEIGRAHV